MLLSYKLNKSFRRKKEKKPTPSFSAFSASAASQTLWKRLYILPSLQPHCHLLTHPFLITPSYFLMIRVVFYILSHFSVYFDEPPNTLTPSFHDILHFKPLHPYFCSRIHSHRSCNQFLHPYQSLETLLFDLIRLSIDFLPHFLKSASLFLSLHYS